MVVLCHNTIRCLCSTVQLYVQFYKTVNIHTHKKFNSTTIDVLDSPEIDGGSHVIRPSVITRGNKTVNIGTPVYAHTGYDVIIDCNIVNGTPPITVQWFHNGSPDPTRGNVSTITITDASNDDVFQCRADNTEGFDTENTAIYVQYGKYLHMYIPIIQVYRIIMNTFNINYSL